ncbi:hypothetical protein [Haloferula sp. A504]|uniref:hypothetical protein n=1 Tax=Haloferula sp. A504 TaxID=3373601 RepID=UPI0031BF70B0|nr:hypothetical protein [Verrucomicrobiaceae bacterium E54]
MKNRLFKLALVALLPATITSCTTTYDAYGNPVQSVTPEGAAAMAIGAAVVGAAVANHNNRDKHYYNNYGYYGRPSYHNGRRCYYRGGRRYYY